MNYFAIKDVLNETISLLNIINYNKRKNALNVKKY